MNTIITNKINNTINYTTKLNNNILSESNILFGTKTLSKNGIKNNKISSAAKIDAVKDDLYLHDLTDDNINDIFNSIKKIKTNDKARYNINIFTQFGPVTYMSKLLTKDEILKFDAHDLIGWLDLKYHCNALGISLTIF